MMDRYSPNVLLVQESSHPSEHLGNELGECVESEAVWAQAYGSKGKRKWGSYCGKSCSFK